MKKSNESISAEILEVIESIEVIGKRTLGEGGALYHAGITRNGDQGYDGSLWAARVHLKSNLLVSILEQCEMHAP